MDMTKYKDGKVHFKNSWVKGLRELKKIRGHDKIYQNTFKKCLCVYVCECECACVHANLHVCVFYTRNKHNMDLLVISTHNAN